MQNRFLRVVVATSLVLAVWAGDARDARACYYGGCGDAFAALGVVVLLVGVGDLTILGADLAYAVQGRWLPDGWRAANLVVGGLHLLTGAILLASVPWRSDEPAIGIGFGVAAVGLIMVTDAVLSLILGRDPPAPGEASVSLSPRPGGGVLGLAGRF